MLLENGNATALNGHVQVQSVKLIEEGLFTYAADRRYLLS